LSNPAISCRRALQRLRHEKSEQQANAGAADEQQRSIIDKLQSTGRSDMLRAGAHEEGERN
jgi:hypothetical protein